MNEFKVGDKVECLVYGKGEVVDIRKSYPEYPVGVKFESGRTDNYTKDGRLRAGYNVTLTKGTWKVEEVLPEVTYKQGELVWCDVRKNYEWQLATYASKVGDLHHITTKVGSSGWCVTSRSIRKFKDIPYDIND